jgi:lipoyl(octanoyl) transferase
MRSTRSTADDGSEAPAPPLAVRSLGRVDYREAWRIQRELVERRIRDEIPDTLVLLEHPPVFTLGRGRGAARHVLEPGEVPVVEVERGGDATWHGPGQLVGYPILRLAPDERDLHRLLRGLEGALIEVLAACSLRGERRPPHTGVWCGARKVASIGVAVRSWVTWHGFALNVDPDLSWFARLRPCGLPAEVMASVASLGGQVPARDALEAITARAVARSLSRDLQML